MIWFIQHYSRVFQVSASLEVRLQKNLATVRTNIIIDKRISCEVSGSYLCMMGYPHVHDATHVLGVSGILCMPCPCLSWAYLLRGRDMSDAFTYYASWPMVAHIVDVSHCASASIWEHMQ